MARLEHPYQLPNMVGVPAPTAEIGCSIEAWVGQVNVRIDIT